VTKFWTDLVIWQRVPDWRWADADGICCQR